ncbi:DsbA family protein [Lysobacter sp. BMK333-48F3]|uniref:2-hydroxychromene-2-carboxylate isomerase n=1 Tax=Lysobacter sp. BMK333-48F3 TaxID=2867962 RepID=UPI001C8C010F|nr:DsbA family protein [Lysobacter sp. BMK333-48F3]
MSAAAGERRWFFDFISPFAYLHWQKLRPRLAELAVEPVPIVFAAVLQARGQKGPAEIPGKREFTYRHTLWQARRDGVELRYPPAHPFNPIAALRLCIVAGGTPEAVDAIFDWIWRRGQAGDGIEALQPVIDALGVDPAALGAEATKTALRANTDAAIAAGVYGVPTLKFGSELFWGYDAHEFALAALQHPELLHDPEMQRLTRLPLGQQRRT